MEMTTATSDHKMILERVYGGTLTAKDAIAEARSRKLFVSKRWSRLLYNAEFISATHRRFK